MEVTAGMPAVEIKNRLALAAGAALLVEWETLTAESHTAILQCASSLHAGRDAARIKGEIAQVMERSGHLLE